MVDRKDLDYQTMKEYQRFSPDSVNGSNSTLGLKRNIEKDDNIILVDYKTDRKKSEQELIEKYSLQLSYYTEALEAALHQFLPIARRTHRIPNRNFGNSRERNGEGKYIANGFRSEDDFPQDLPTFSSHIG